LQQQRPPYDAVILSQNHGRFLASIRTRGYFRLKPSLFFAPLIFRVA
jgi:hypothetical protein